MDKQTKAKLKIMQEYAKAREQKHAASMIAKDYAKEFTKRYEEVLESITKEIEAFYSIYAEKEKITLAEARRRASQLDVERFEKKAKKYVKEKDFSKKANEELRLYNLTMKANRLELLKNNIALELIHLGDDSEKYMRYVLNDEALAEIQRQAGILGKTAWHDPEMVQQIIDASFYDATFSDRIWADQYLLKASIDQQLTKGIIQGINPKGMAGKIRDLFQSTQKQAERLLITESARVQTAIQKASFEKYGYEEYLFIAEPGACKVCGALAKKESYKTADMQPGINAAPIHPYCRCSVAAVFSDEEWKKDLETRLSKKKWSEYIDGIDEVGQNKLSWIHEELFKFGQNHGREKMYLLNILNNRVIYEKEGTVNSVEFDNQIREILKDSEKNSLVLAHNHPGKYNSSFSQADILQLLNYESIRSMTLETSNGSQYVMGRQNNFFNKLTLFSFPMKYDKILKSVSKRYDDIELNWEEIIHEVNIEVAEKYKLLYKKVK